MPKLGVAVKCRAATGTAAIFMTLGSKAVNFYHAPNRCPVWRLRAKYAGRL